MPVEIRHYTATCPAGTPLASPFEVSVAFPPRIVRSVYWRVPNGPMGVFGWQLAMGGLVVFPTMSDQFVIANDEHDTWLPERAPDSGAWQVIMYNTGTHPHSVYLAFGLDLIDRPPPLAQLTHPIELGPAPDLSAAGPPVIRRLA